MSGTQLHYGYKAVFIKVVLRPEIFQIISASQANNTDKKYRTTLG